MADPNGFSVRIYVPSGDPDALRLVEKTNWTGMGMVFPRALFAEVRKRPELQRAGVYLLWGWDASGQLPRAYIGEGDVVLPRLEQHEKKKDFWTHAIVFTSKDQNLNKAHVQYLEARLIELASAAKRAQLDNGNVPQLPRLSDADAADAESFLENLLLCLPVLGVSFFEKAKMVVPKQGELFLKARGIEARGALSNEGFVVRKGSCAAKDETPSAPSFLRNIRLSLIRQGVFKSSSDCYLLTQDYTFNSPSAAAGVLLGRSVNGRTAWRDSNKHSLKEIQEAGVSGS